MEPEQAASMAELRRLIDRLDLRLPDLFARRMACIEPAITLKQAEGLPARTGDRVRAVPAQIRQRAAGRGLDPDPMGGCGWR